MATKKTGSKVDAKVLRAVTQRVVDNYTGAAALFTALDVSNAVKATLPEVRHREVAPLVRELFSRRAMGDYQQSTIDVLAGGTTPAQAFLYHLPEHSPELYDDAMRSQLAIPPVSASLKNDDPLVTQATTEWTVTVGRDGRGRVPRQVVQNAGVVGEEVYVAMDPAGGRLELREAGADDDGTGEAIAYEHPTLLHVPRRYMQTFGPGAAVVARVLEGRVELRSRGS